ncbi:recombinase family protein [Agrobacterium tumefaciens]|uniref:recombinase family protein n=1 Tax=Agrobacterium tumefaciens TaxID=358 RepID=UPI001B8A4CA4|nr:recombinase family protein [Agrobacterium tumefaciens]WCJ63828.1 recombinase family protein [Agrobacterium tumefaciens]
MSKYVAYFRVSTARQGQSGLGLDAQKASVQRFAMNDEIVAEYIEVESGKKNDRPALAKALSHARESGAILLIAKLDRLSRNLAFIANLLESGVEIQAVDMPSANRMMLQMMAVFAEEEARAISVRTKAALAAAKERGTVLGGIRQGSMETNRKRGNASTERAMTLIQTIPDYESTSFNMIAKTLNEKGFKTIKNKDWTAMQVSRAIQRHTASHSAV